MDTNTKSKIIAIIICALGVIGIAVCAVGFGMSSYKKKLLNEEELEIEIF